jgi:hypothetical protein
MPLVKPDKRFPLTTAECDFIALNEELGIDRKCYTCISFYVCDRDLSKCGSKIWNTHKEDVEFNKKIDKHFKSLERIFKKINKER